MIPVGARSDPGVRAVAISEDGRDSQMSGLDEHGRTAWSVRVPFDSRRRSWYEGPAPDSLIASSGRVFAALDTLPATVVALDSATGAQAYRVGDAFADKRARVHLAGEVAGDLIAVGRLAADTTAVRLSSANGRVMWRTELGVGKQITWSRIVDDQLVVVGLGTLDIVALDSGQSTKLNAIDPFVDGRRILAYDLENHIGRLSEYDRVGHRLSPILVGGQEVRSNGGTLIALRSGLLVNIKSPTGLGLSTRLVAMPFREGVSGYDEPLPDGFGVRWLSGWQEQDTRWRVAGDEAHRFMLLELTRLEGVDAGQTSRLAIVDLDNGQTRWTSATYPAHDGSLIDDSIFYADGYYIAMVLAPVGGEARRALLVLDARTGVFMGAVGIVRASDTAGAASYPGSPNPWSVRDGVLYDHSADTAWALDLATLSLVLHPPQIRAELVTQQVAASLGPLPLK